MSNQILNQTLSYNMFHLFCLKCYFAESTVHLNCLILIFFFMSESRRRNWPLDIFFIILNSKILTCEKIKFIFPIFDEDNDNLRKSDPICFLYEMNQLSANCFHFFKVTSFYFICVKWLWNICLKSSSFS